MSALSYERADAARGTVLFAAGALGVLLACALVLSQQSALGPAGLHGAFTAAVARGLRTRAGGAAGALFAVVLMAGSFGGTRSADRLRRLIPGVCPQPTLAIRN